MLTNADLLEPFALLETFIPKLMSTFRTGIVEKKAMEPYFFEEGCSVQAAEIGNDGKRYIAVIPIFGTLSPDGRYGGTSTNAVVRMAKQFDANPNVSDILLHIKSPGGTVTGTIEAADAIRAIRDSGNTQVTAFADGMMASAATWIGTAANKVYISPSGEAGSIGVISMYADLSRMYSDMGIDVTVMRTPEKKARFTGIEPLTDEMRQAMEIKLASACEAFISAMVQNRGKKDVAERFGGGEMMSAKDSVESGLVDGIATFDDLVSQLAAKKMKRKQNMAAELAKLDLMELDY